MKLLQAMEKRDYGLIELMAATGKTERYCRMLMKGEKRPGINLAFLIVDWLKPDTTIEELTKPEKY